MPIPIPGRLTIIERNGRNGRFCVGSLSTEIGEFVVKDASLDQFGVGTYAGRFVIDRIYLSSRTWQNRLFTDIVATLAGITLDENGIDEGAPANLPPDIPDPLDEAPQHPASKKDAESPAGSPETPDSTADTGDTLISLFGAETAKLLRERKPVKLDPTTERTLFRQQIAMLKEKGEGGLRYRWEPTDQTWHPLE